MSKHIDQFN